MKHLRVTPIAAGLALSLLSGLTMAQSLSASRDAPETDDATGRRKAMESFYETPYDAKFKRFMNDAAARERSRWARLMPTGTAFQPSTLPDQILAPVPGNTWANIGPTNATVIKNGSSTLNNVADSGRPVEIIVDPSNVNTIYLATAGGGLWKTTDGGVSWQPKTETLGSLSVGSLAMDPTNSQTLYLGLGDAFDGTGLGLVKSTNGGETWSAPVYLGASTQIRDLIVSGSNNQIVMAATDAGLFRSTNGGTSFTQVSLSTGFAVASSVWDLENIGTGSFGVTLEANPAATSGTTSGQYWRTTDNGATWTQSTPTVTGGIGRVSIASAPSNRSIVYAMAAKPLATTSSDLADILRSTNGGTTWTSLGATKNATRYSNTNTESTKPITILNGQGWYNHMLIVHPTDSNTFFFGGALLLAKGVTAASGTSATFTQMSNWLAQFSLPYVHADMHAAAFASNGTMYVGSDGGIFKSTNFGTSWTDDLNVGIASHLIYSVGSSPAAPNAVIGGFQDNGTRVRSGSTSTFNQYLGGDGFGSHIHKVNGSQMLGSLYYARIYKSTNGGTTFATASSGITESNNSSTAPFVTHITAWDGDSTGNTVFTHVNLKVYKSTNYATSWTALGTSGLPTTSFVIRNVDVAQSNVNNVGISASGGRVYFTTNGGTSWVLGGTLPNNSSSINSIAYDRTNPSVIYVASVAPVATAAHLWKSTNGGTTFTAIDGAGSGFPAGVPVNEVTTDPGASNVVYAATHLGVYKSTDSGATWTRFGTGLPLVNTTDFYISPASDKMRVSTFGRGFWELTP